MDFACQSLLEGRPAPAKQGVESQLRERYAYFDWMRSLQCGLASNSKASCATTQAHVMRRWQSSVSDKATPTGEQQAWMVAALMLADKLDPLLEQAALSVVATAPEYLTVQYHLARLYRLAGQTEKTRRTSAHALQSPALAQAQSNSASFLLQQERFASASSLDDAANFLMRKRKGTRDPDTGDTRPDDNKQPASDLAADGMVWLDTRLSIGDLLALAKKQSLPASIRARLATAAWMRADFLNKPAMAKQAARIAQISPHLHDAATAYIKENNTQNKRHLLVMSSLRLGLSPLVMEQYKEDHAQPFEAFEGVQERTVVSMWCSIAKPDVLPHSIQARVEEAPPPPDLSTQASIRDREIAALAKIPTATGFVGAHVLARVKTHPTDPDLPWLLYVVVQSTRGGCVDPGKSTLSRTAYTVLHTRFKNSPWAEKTPYWY